MKEYTGDYIVYKIFNVSGVYNESVVSVCLRLNELLKIVSDGSNFGSNSIGHCTGQLVTTSQKILPMGKVKCEWFLVGSSTSLVLNIAKALSPLGFGMSCFSS